MTNYEKIILESASFEALQNICSESVILRYSNGWYHIDFQFTGYSLSSRAMEWIWGLANRYGSDVNMFWVTDKTITIKVHELPMLALSEKIMEFLAFAGLVKEKDIDWKVPGEA